MENLESIKKQFIGRKATWAGFRTGKLFDVEVVDIEFSTYTPLDGRFMPMDEVRTWKVLFKERTEDGSGFTKMNYNAELGHEIPLTAENIERCVGKFRIRFKD